MLAKYGADIPIADIIGIICSSALVIVFFKGLGRDMHTAIIDKGRFFRIQEIRKERKYN